MKSRAMVWAQRLCLCVVVFASANWLLNVLHYRWVVRHDRVQVATWMGCLEINWYESRGFAVAKVRRAELSRGGVTGRNGLATILAHVQWLPWVEQFDISGQPKSAVNGSPSPFARDHIRITLPMWGLGVLSAIPYMLLAARARRRRKARLCDVCDYSLVGLTAGVDGKTLCPECGSRVSLPDATREIAS